MDLLLTHHSTSTNASGRSVITIFQTFWFGAGIVERACTGLSMTTMELTTSSFVLLMLATSAAWYHKPSITQPRFICSKNSQSVQSIRNFSQANVSKVKHFKVGK
jgi:hypothetical protein